MNLTYLSLILVSFVTVLSAQYRYSTAREDFDTTQFPEFTSSNWMAFIDHSRSVSSLSIPGTHMSLSIRGGTKNQHQSWSLYSQFEAGIRYVDIRCRHRKNNLFVHQGLGSEESFDDVFDEAIRFLNAFQSETILMRIRREGIPNQNWETIGDTFKRLLIKYPSNRFWPSGRIPTMSEARGRIIILQDFYGTPQVGHQYRYLTIEDSGNPRNQNAINYKWERVQHHLNAAMRDDKGSFYLTHTAGSGEGVSPRSAASKINRRLWDFMRMYEGRRMRLGIIAMDFPGARLIKRIANSNF